MRRIRITEEIKPGVYKAREAGLAPERMVTERLAFVQARGADVVWEVAKPVDYDSLVQAHAGAANN